MRQCVFIFVAFCLVHTAQAKQPWTLRECISYAVENNLDIRQQKLVIENSEIELNTSRNSRLPDLSAGLGQSFNFGRSQSSTTGIYDANTSTSTNLSVATSIPVFSGFRISNEIKSNELNLKAATEGLKKAEENLSLTVTSYYLDVLFKKEMVKVRQQQFNLTSRQAERTEALVESGSVPKSNLLDIQAQIAGDESNLVAARNEVIQALCGLALLLNVPEPGSFDVIEPDIDRAVAELAPELRSPETIYQTAIAVKPHVKEAEYKLESSRKDVQVARSALWPTVSLGASYNNGFDHVFDNTFNNDSFKTQFKRNQREAVGLSLSIPIFSRLKTRNQIRTAQLGALSKEIDLENVKQELYKEIYQAHTSAVSAQAQYRAKENAYMAAAEAYKYAEERYQHGKSSVYEFMESQTQMATSLSEQLQAKYDFLFRMKILQFYSGMPIDFI